MQESASLPPWARVALVALALFAIVRGVALPCATNRCSRAREQLRPDHPLQRVRLTIALPWRPRRPDRPGESARAVFALCIPAAAARFVHAELGSSFHGADRVGLAHLRATGRTRDPLDPASRRMAAAGLVRRRGVGDAFLSARAARRSCARASRRIRARRNGPGQHALPRDVLRRSGRGVRVVASRWSHWSLRSCGRRAALWR